MIFANGTTGSEHKFDRWTEAQQKQNEYAVREDEKERFDTPPQRSDEGDRLAEVASAARVQAVLLGEMCFSLLRCRERATDHGYSDVVLAVQPLVDLYQDRLKVAKEAYEAADFESRSFDVRNAP